MTWAWTVLAIVAGKDWSLAHAKVEHEGMCRVCPARPPTRIDPAHVIPRSMGGSPGPVIRPNEIVPLCRDCHELHERHELDLLPYLTKPEQATAVLRVGMLAALQQITGEKWRPA